MDIETKSCWDCYWFVRGTFKCHKDIVPSDYSVASYCKFFEDQNIKTPQQEDKTGE